MKKKIVGNVHKNISTLYYNLGVVYDGLNNKEMAEKCYQISDEIENELKNIDREKKVNNFFILNYITL